MNHTPSQRRAIDSDAKNILCVAGPGSGKTATTVARICRLIDSGVPQRGIVALTFTNAAARELERRLHAALNKDHVSEGLPGDYLPQPEDVRLGYCGTLHGFALKMLKQHGQALGYGDRIAIINEEATLDLLASKAQSLGCKMPIDKLLKLKAEWWVNAVTPRAPVEFLVLKGYYDDLREAGLVDFDSILWEFLRLLNTVIIPHGATIENAVIKIPPCGEFTHLFVDEVQDSSDLDWRIFHALPMARKFMVGDQDQSIYAFRGGRPGLMQDWGKLDRVEVHILEENFRSHAEICDAAQRLIEHNVGRIAKRTVSVKGAGGSVTKQITGAANAGHEIAMVAHQIQKHHVGKFSEIAVLTRTNALAHDFRETLKAAGIPVVEPPKSDLPKDWPVCRSLIDLLVNPENDTLACFYLLTEHAARGQSQGDARKVVHQMQLDARREGKSMNQHVFMREYAGVGLAELPTVLAKDGITAESRMLVAQKIRQLPAGAELLDLALLLGQHDAPDQEEKQEGVTVCTLHAAKGREWDVVFLVGFEDEAIPGQRKSDGPEEVAESRRLAYVGMTRARSHLYISHAAQREMTYGAFKKIEARTPSRFIVEALG